MAYYKVGLRPGVIGIRRGEKSIGVGEAICTMRRVVAVVDRPQGIEDEEAGVMAMLRQLAHRQTRG